MGVEPRPPVIHASLHARPADRLPIREIDVYGFHRRVCDVSANQLRHPLSVTFEELTDRFMAQPRLFCEPDGSFVWVGQDQDDEHRWQIDGQLNDSAEGLMSIEVKFAGRITNLSTLWQLCGAPEQRLLVQLVQFGVYLETDEFGKLLARG